MVCTTALHQALSEVVFLGRSDVDFEHRPDFVVAFGCSWSGSKRQEDDVR